MVNIVIEAIRGGLEAVLDYLSAHVLACLVPAFFIAGAIGVFLKKEAILRYFGPDAPKGKAYGLAAVSGTVLAVCSCTILPLFAGIYKKGSGIGPATAFLYSGPAINVLAMVYTARVLGYELGAARATAAVAMSVLIGLAMATLFGGEAKRARDGDGRKKGGGPGVNGPRQAGDQGDGSKGDGSKGDGSKGDGGTASDEGLLDARGRPDWTTPALFVVLVAVLLVGASGLGLLPKVVTVTALAAVTAALLYMHYTKQEVEEWGGETWDLTKKVFPLLIAGTFAVGVIAVFLPPSAFGPWLGDESPGANLLGAVIGALLYMPTLLEVPIIAGTLGYTEGHMGEGPALALLLAGPAVSLPNMLVLYRLLGNRKTAAYIGLVVAMSSVAGYIYGNFIV